MSVYNLFTLFEREWDEKIKKNVFLEICLKIFIEIFS